MATVSIMHRVFRILLRPVLAVLLLGAALQASADQVGAPATDPIEITSASGEMIPVTLPLNKARLVRLPVDVRDVLATNEEVADVIVKSPRLVYLLGNQVGSTNVLFLDAGGREIARLDIRVEVDLSALDQMFDLLMPDEDIDVVSINENLALTGTVSTPQVSANALTIAARFAPLENVVNLLNVRNEQQVLLKVRFTEMNRQASKEFGIDTNWTPGFTPFGAAIGLATGTGATANTFGTLTTTSDRLTTATNVLERNNLIKVLAEPTVTAISGELATVLVGGEFPIPVPGQNGSVTIEFRRFGVVLEFTPIVLSDDRISLHINTEVSAISTQNQINIQGFQIPSLTVRRATTSVDLPSGGSLVIAGLLQNDIIESLDGFPGLKDIPVLGTLFRSTTFASQETELVVLVTPYVVRPITPDTAASPVDGFMPPSDIELYFMGRLTGVYGTRRTLPAPGEVPADVGFIVE
jgi:pilus assembly protein CpaC